MSNGTQVTLLIDGDQCLHVGTIAVEKEVKWDEENWVLFSNEPEAITAVEYEIGKIVKKFSNPKVILCFSSPPLFRTSVAETYKSHRATRKPLAYSAVREYLERTYTTKKLPGLEADDVMGILATSRASPCGLSNDNTVICSRDKDMQQIPGALWNGTEHHWITEDDGDRFFMFQTLTGDTSDGYKGCPGIGPAKAEKVLAQAADKPAMWKAVVEAFEKVGLTADDALVQARLARILRAEDWDFEKKEVKLWQPPLI